MKTDVLIVGAGPTGLVLALWLTKQNVAVRIIDKTAEAGTASRALGVQARTLELYRQMNLSDEVVAAGQPNPIMNLWSDGKKRAHVSYSDVGEQVTPYPYILLYPQDQHERLLIQHLEKLGIQVERNVELVSFEDQQEKVVSQLKTAAGMISCESRYVAACDGAKSTVRHILGTDFSGGTYPQIFYVADVDVEGAAVDGQVHLALDDADIMMMLAYGDLGQARLIGIVNQDKIHKAPLTFDDVSDKAIKSLGLTVNKVNWFSTYRVHHRVAKDYRHGNVFLLGDAAHLHSPIGAQGMNTGIGDAINLAWKLANVIQGHADQSLLNTYQIERHTFAEKLVKTTDQMFSFMVADNPLTQVLRAKVAPIIAPLIYNIDFVRKHMFKIMSQISLSYENSPLSLGKVGKIEAGQRLPWLKTASMDNFDSLNQMIWQIHVYGQVTADVQQWAVQHHIVIQQFAWQAEFKHAGFTEDMVILLRPDSYIAVVSCAEDAVDLLQQVTELYHFH
ncbi:FAD-dependent monooxygenase [Acinetobacter puyangensis]|uniref:2-polyprenyl-6-methoxyphenol hydroxylase n=1 Tax=Acinetobacter puyangensis TaxID=1096779 RepID=A0A240E5K9_9GAMM|nr:FAD-dependent monooxygenase [Acinetobacter puyangensis]SNX43872.1 2-polyprenyl-6-methoxyphenol hydroxylase [Acinetobacter puyangensis]